MAGANAQGDRLDVLGLRLKLRFRRRQSKTPDAAGFPSARGLFVVGVARGGTTVLQNALNDAREIFLLGEADLHLDQGGHGFASRYNAMHEAWGNQPTKSSYLPPTLDEDGAWDAHLTRLARLHRWVGTKIVANAGKPAEWLDRFLAFHCDRFYEAHYIFVFRHPADVLASTVAFQQMSGQAATDAMILANYAQTLALFTRLVRILPNVRALIHEDIDAQVFATLSDWLGTPLDGASAYYDRTKERRRGSRMLAADDAHGLDLLTTAFEDLRGAVSTGFERLQLEQNNRNPDPAHFTAIGSLDARVNLIERFLRERS